jgi:hypothetical protein
MFVIDVKEKQGLTCLMMDHDPVHLEDATIEIPTSTVVRIRVVLPMNRAGPMAGQEKQSFFY